MKRSISQIQYRRLLATYLKLNNRLNKNFASGRFIEFTTAQQVKLIQRLERMKVQLACLNSELKLGVTAFVLGTLLHSTNLQAQFLATGSEFRVNTYTINDQHYPSVAMDSDGDFVVAWQSRGQDGSDFGIYAQRYNAVGVAQGSEFRVNTYTTDYQVNPSVAMDSDGDFVITWQSRDQVRYRLNIYAQRYNNLGEAQRSEFAVGINSYVFIHQINHSVTMDSDSNFMIIWESWEPSGIFVQRYNAMGVSQGLDLKVEEYRVREPAIALRNKDGDFVVTWVEGGNAVTFGDAIYAQRFNAFGLEQGSKFRVNTYTSIMNKNAPSIAMDNDGNCVMSWQSQYQDGSSYGVFAQRYIRIQSSADLNALRLFPNPSKDQVYLNVEGEAGIRIYNSSGNLVKVFSLKNNGFTVSDLNPGLYLVEINKDGSTAMKKLVVE